MSTPSTLSFVELIAPLALGAWAAVNRVAAQGLEGVGDLLRAAGGLELPGRLLVVDVRIGAVGQRGSTSRAPLGSTPTTSVSIRLAGRSWPFIIVTNSSAFEIDGQLGRADVVGARHEIFVFLAGRSAALPLRALQPLEDLHLVGLDEAHDASPPPPWFLIQSSCCAGYIGL